MAKNKQQLAAEARAKAVQPVAEQPKQEAPEKLIEYDVKEAIARGEGERGGHDTVKATPAQAATVSKQDLTIEKLKEGWTAKGVNLDKLTVKDDGKFKLVVVAEGWPTVQIGPTGGITVLELRSYQKAFDAAMDGLALYEKQKARDANKASASQPAAPKAAEQNAVTA